ncbi:ubiquitin thioesterase Otu1 [Lepeophtheirus salmonis]|uniref:Ubiquitin thioesterase OTU n=1 Tax=Lepeophtheirus salmonis TaxID=72036 RepID=A0A0K2US92_LEPSM|nr:ubiquitin thioesterase OTU1-like [Lepeophtheirus salmonis]XP_040578996.1 ubiquitin thioesterase OTU1-like [Lepeophtheirus salmonis]
MNLRIKKASDGSAVTLSLEEDATLTHVLQKIDADPKKTRVLCGYPPKPILEADQPLSELGVRSGDVLIREEEEAGVIERKEVPADNSCLFTSVNYCLSGVVDISKCELMRTVVVGVIQSQPQQYDAAILGKDPKDYIAWISSSDAWGGAIEAQILAEYFGMEIDVFDTQSGLLTRFGESYKPGQRALIIYDGIHYDPLYERIGSKEKTIFSIDDEEILEKGKSFVESEKKAKKFTDVAGFTLKCEDCGTKLVGQKDAQSHAKSTGHKRFGEV